MKIIKILLLVILLSIIPSSSASIYINQTVSTSTVSVVSTDIIGQNFTIPSFPNASTYSLDYIEVRAQRTLVGTSTINMSISNDTYSSSNTSVDITNTLTAWRFNFSNVLLVNGNKYNFTLYDCVGCGQVTYSYANTNPYSGGLMFLSGVGFPTNDMTFNISLSPHDNVGNWTFNQASGDYANDSSGWNNNGTLFGDHDWSTNFVNGSVNGTSLNFTGLNYVNASNASSLDFNTSDFTFNFWAKSLSSGYLVGKLNFDPVVTGFEIDTATGGGVVRGVIGNGVTTKTVSGTTQINDDKWHMVTLERNGDNLYLFLDNILEGTQTGVSGLNIYNAANLYFGRAGSDNNIGYAHSVLDEITAYNYALNTSERTAVYQKFQAVPKYPVANTNISVSASTKSVNFTWHDTLYSQDELIIATDSGFTAIVHDAFYTNDFANISLTSNTTYYWKVRQFNSGTGSYGNVSEVQKFTLGKFNGYLNILVLDEMTFLKVNNYNATIYNGVVKSKSTINGVVNFTSSDIEPGQFQLVITVNSTYGERAIIVNSPGNYTVFVPSTTAYTVDFVSFYLLDYTGRFPYANTNLTITKGVNITHSQYFDSDAKVATNLIRGERYTLTVYNPSTSDMQTWGDYSSSGTGSVQVVISAFGINESILKPYAQSISRDGNDINFAWNDRNNVLNWVNITVYQDNYSYLVYSLNTSINAGTATFTITNTSALYFAQMNASTTRSDTIDSLIIDLRTGTELIRNLSYGSFSIPTWFKNALAIVLMFMLAGSFGAMHRGEGAIITGFIGVYLWYIGWLIMSTAIAALFGSMVMFAVVYHMNTKSKPGYF